MEFLEKKLKEMRKRLAVLTPAVDESKRLELAIAELEEILKASNSSTRAKQPTRKTSKAKRQAPSDSGRPRGRPKGSGTRGRQALRLVQKHPGITIPELAKKMKIKQNYLYRVLPGLATDGLVRKEGTGWHATGS
ncbi:MAG TPA: hypothetical protein VLF21_01560 [Candidatus Saccharimonadales bacterium]|nr:hypothetical protein [Candidatus Saccharimonadales bacterium]